MLLHYLPDIAWKITSAANRPMDSSDVATNLGWLCIFEIDGFLRSGKLVVLTQPLLPINPSRWNPIIRAGVGARIRSDTLDFTRSEIDGLIRNKHKTEGQTLPDEQAKQQAQKARTSQPNNVQEQSVRGWSGGMRGAIE